VNGVFDRVLQETEGVQPANTPLQPGPAALTDGVRAIQAVIEEWAARAAD